MSEKAKTKALTASARSARKLPPLGCLPAEREAQGARNWGRGRRWDVERPAYLGSRALDRPARRSARGGSRRGAGARNLCDARQSRRGVGEQDGPELARDGRQRFAFARALNDDALLGLRNRCREHELLRHGGFECDWERRNRSVDGRLRNSLLGRSRLGGKLFARGRRRNLRGRPFEDRLRRSSRDLGYKPFCSKLVRGALGLGRRRGRGLLARGALGLGRRCRPRAPRSRRPRPRSPGQPRAPRSRRPRPRSPVRPRAPRSRRPRAPLPTPRAELRPAPSRRGISPRRQVKDG